MKYYAIIAAAGSGSRLGSGLPKQFLTLDGRPLIYYAIEKFLKTIPGIRVIVAIPPSHKENFEEIKLTYFKEYPVEQVFGGDTRFHSIKNALANIENNNNALIAVHDAARPFTSNDLISICFNEAREKGCAIPAVNLKDSIREKIGDKWVSQNRKNFKLIQTPQVFNLMKLKNAYDVVSNNTFTDDASVYENAGNPIYIVNGEDGNFKITTREDLMIAEHIFKES